MLILDRIRWDAVCLVCIRLCVWAIECTKTENRLSQHTSRCSGVRWCAFVLDGCGISFSSRRHIIIQRASEWVWKTNCTTDRSNKKMLRSLSFLFDRVVLGRLLRGKISAASWKLNYHQIAFHCWRLCIAYRSGSFTGESVRQIGVDQNIDHCCKSIR